MGYMTLIQNSNIPKTEKNSGYDSEVNTINVQHLGDETINWKIYKNGYFNFEIKYPLEMTFVEQKSDIDRYGEVTPVIFYEKSARGEFADRLLIKIIKQPLAGDRTSPFNSLDDYIDYSKQLLSKAENLRDIHFTKFSMNGLEFVKETYIGPTLQSSSGLETAVLYSLYHDGLIYLFVLGSNNLKRLDTYETMVKTFRFTE